MSLSIIERCHIPASTSYISRHCCHHLSSATCENFNAHSSYLILSIQAHLFVCFQCSHTPILTESAASQKLHLLHSVLRQIRCIIYSIKYLSFIVLQIQHAAAILVLLSNPPVATQYLLRCNSVLLFLLITIDLRHISRKSFPSPHLRRQRHSLHFLSNLHESLLLTPAAYP